MVERMPETTGAAQQPAPAATPPFRLVGAGRALPLRPRRATRVAAGAAVLLVAAAAALHAWRGGLPQEPGPGFVSGNGRIEAVEVDIATRQPGRIADIFVDEGDTVQAGQVVARMDLPALKAERAESVARAAGARPGDVERKRRHGPAGRARSTLPSWHFQ